MIYNVNKESVLLISFDPIDSKFFVHFILIDCILGVLC
jgi:hypothetical protein